MAIQSKKPETTDRVIKPSPTQEEQLSEVQLRPQTLDEYVGQREIKKHLNVAIESAQIRKKPLDHILLYGPPGLGKTTLSIIIANQMGGNIKMTSGPAIEKQADILSILTNLQEGDILFIDEIHRLRAVIEEILYGAMEDFTVDIMLGTGPGATSVKMDLPNFTLIGATTKLSSLTSPLRDRFGNVLKLDFYESDDLEKIVTRSSKLLECPVNDEVAKSIATRSRGTPRISNRLTKIIRDYMTVGQEVVDEASTKKVFDALGIDEYGLDNLDRKLLTELLETFSGGPVGLGTLASVVGEEEATLEDVIEPYLLKIGFLERTPRGRKITDKGEKYLREL